jgi:hypothetical protein
MSDETEDPALQELRQAYRSGELVLFVGAGISAAAGLPSWEALVELLIQLARAHRATEEEINEVLELKRTYRYIDALTALRGILGPAEFTSAIAQKLDDRGVQPPQVAKAIAALGTQLRAVLTTNIDHLLEHAFAGAWPPIWRATGNIAMQRRVIIKLHGTLMDSSTWVFTRDEYDRAMYADPALKSTFTAFFHSCPILFVGYGLQDDDFDHVLARVRAFAGHQPPRHFALVDAATATPYRMKRLSGSGIRLITYRNNDGRHGEVLSLLQSLKNAEHGATAPRSDGEGAGSAVTSTSCVPPVPEGEPTAPPLDTDAPPTDAAPSPAVSPPPGVPQGSGSGGTTPATTPSPPELANLVHELERLILNVDFAYPGGAEPPGESLRA